VGYAEQDRVGVVSQFETFIESYPDVLASTVALALIVFAAALSIRAVRRKMRYETWWSVHLYMYLALALAFAHQIANGQSFVGHPLTRVIWATLGGTTAGVVLVFRFVMPIGRSLYHRLEVVGIHGEAAGVVSVVCRGRHLDRLKVEGGQFFQWRFLARGMWWQAHPYSVSALPRTQFIRITVKEFGDHSQGLSQLHLGTRVFIEGPYGAFTRHARATDKVLLVGGGVGLTPIRALLEHLDRNVDVAVVLRFSRPDQRLFQAEFESLVARHNGQIHELIGPRRQYSLDARHLRSLVPDIAERDVYVCGPEALSERVIASARALGVEEKRIHCEQFAF
jgi:ferredoxin-NADP reductase